LGKMLHQTTQMEAVNNTEPAVSVIIPCRNERNHIETVIRSILDQKPPPGGFEVIVADGMSDDGTREILRRLSNDDSRLHIVDNPGLIVSKGLNVGIRKAKGNVIMRMDAHTEYAADYIFNCVEILRATGADNVGGPWIAKGTGLIAGAIAAASQSSFACGGAYGHNPDYEGIVDTVYLGCWPRDVFDRIGMFDEELVRNQDDEFNLRLARAGGKIWQSPRISSRYIARNSLLALFRQYQQYGYWKVRVIQKHRRPASVRHIVPGIFTFLLVMLPLLSFLWLPFLAFWALLLATYCVSAVVAAFMTAAQPSWKLFSPLPVIFACYHFGYGTGFLRGIWDFIFRSRAPNSRYTELTRDSTGQSTTLE
jgi:glycosyltransferase involved in cell wall biosynthesis